MFQTRRNGTAGSEPERTGYDTVIGKGFVAEGGLLTGDGIALAGTLRGDIQCKRLWLAQGGQVRGDIRASEVEIAGTVSGTISSERVILRSDCQVTGDIAYQSLMVEFGARLQGQCRRRPTAQKPVPQLAVAS